MRAAVLGKDGTLALEDLAMPEPGPDEVRVAVAYCGVCHSDLHVISGHAPFPRPCVLGHEISGTVDAVGEGVAALAVGQAVVCSFVMPCGRCRACASGNDELCIPFLEQNRVRGVLYDGASRHRRHDGEPVAMYSMGGLAEYCCVPATDVFPVPDGLDMREAAIVGCSTFTAFGAVKNVGDVGVGSTVAVIGAGGVGSSIVQLCKLAGARTIVAVDVDEAKRDPVLGLGATHFVNSREVAPTEAIAEITGGIMVDVAFEALGLPETVETAVAALREGGRAVVIGLPGDVKTAGLDIGRLVRRRLTVAGSYGAHTRADMPTLVDLVAQGTVRSGEVISRQFAFDDVAHAYAELAAGRIVGRAVVAVGGSSPAP